MENKTIEKSGVISINGNNLNFNGKKINIDKSTCFFDDAKPITINKFLELIRKLKKIKASLKIKKTEKKIIITDILFNSIEYQKNKKDIGITVPLQFINHDCIKLNMSGISNKIKKSNQVQIDYIIENIPFFNKSNKIMSEVYGGYDLRNKKDLSLIIPNYLKLNANSIETLEINKRLGDVNLPHKNKLI